MGTKELRVSVLELNRISIACPQCKAEMVFDCSGERAPAGYGCVGCGATMNEAMSLARDYRSFFLAVSHMKGFAFTLFVKLDA